MKAKLGFAFVPFIAAIMLANQFSTLSSAAPLASGADPAPAPSPTALLAPTATPKILGHEIVSAFCSTFVERFNVAANTMLADDKLLDDATAAETDYENDFFRLDGALRSWDHRLALIAALAQIMHTIPKTQAAVNDLKAQAAASSDPERRAGLSEGASQLQTSIDHQRIVAGELNDAVDAMLDLHTIEDTIGNHGHGSLGGGRIFSAGAGDAPVPHPGDGLPPSRAAAAYQESALESILHMPRDRQLAANAESRAATAVTPVVRSCAKE